jgi:lipid A 3-O-deacylase
MPRLTTASLVSMAVGLILFLPGERAAAVDSISLDAGMGNHVDVVGISAGSAEWKRWSLANDRSLSLYGKAGLALWAGRDEDPQIKHVVDVSAYPVLRFETGTASQYSPYIEASVGVNLLSHTHINHERDFSTAFQFGEFLGAGVSLGEKRQYDLGLRIQHVSNANIKLPNAGLTLGSVVLGYRFDAP